LCVLYGRPERPRICAELRACEDICGRTAAEALELIAAMEAATGADGETRTAPGRKPDEPAV
jgi:uncharacterized protein